MGRRARPNVSRGRQPAPFLAYEARLFVGSTFVRLHPWFVCTQPNALGLVVVVNVTDASKAFDKTCIIRAGEHPLIIKDSAVYYDLAELFSAASLDTQIKKGVVKAGPTASDELMIRIRDGARDSAHTPDDVRVAVIRCRWKPKP